MMLAALRGVSWSRYALIAGAVVITALAVYGWGYSSGSASATEEMQTRMNQALARQLEELEATRKQHIAAVVRKMTREQHVEGRINDIQIPDTDTCANPEWVRAFNDGVRAAHPGP